MHTEANIIPRLRGRFEPEQNSFHEDVNAAPVNAIDTFAERVNPDENKGLDADTDTSAYRPVINTTRRDNGKPQPDPQPEPGTAAQVNFNAAKAALARPLVFEPPPVADSFKPAAADNAENTIPNEPGLPGKRQTATPHQHNFNTNSLLNAVKTNDSGIDWPKPDAPENGRETTLFAGKRKGNATAESIRGEASSSVQVNEPVQPITTFKSLNTGMQNSAHAVSSPNLGNNSMRDGGQKQFQQTAQPVIKVTIGRIEVKAVHPQAPAPVQRREAQKPALTLDDFLSQHKRNG